MIKYFLLFFLLLVNIHCRAGDADSISTFNPQRARIAGIGLGVTYAASMTGLYKLWYDDYPSTTFHAFDDSHEWKGMDKLGHVGSAYYISRWCNNIVLWTGTSQKKSALIGTGISFLFLSTIELFDAYSTNWGFSSSDMVANTAGCALFLGQQLGWKEQRITMKFSYVPSEFAKYRPDVLGETSLERLFKDYNGQTYWLSFNIYSFLNKDSRFPKWLNLAGGYGTSGLVTAYEQVYEIDQVIFPEAERKREYYISADIDLTKIKWHSKTMRGISEVIGFVKFPLPAVKWSEKRHAEFQMFGF